MRRTIWPAALALLLAGLLTRSAVRAQGPLPVPDFGRALAVAETLPRLHSLLVSWQDELVLERYFNGRDASRLANVKSASKSVVSALVGIAIDRGLITHVKQPVVDFLPEVATAGDEPWRHEMTIEHLLTMSSGLESTSNRNYGRWVQSGNWVRHALSRPLLSRPGTRMRYSTGNTHLLSAILTKASGRNTYAFAQDVLAEPLGFTLARWPRDPQGIYFGGNDMLFTPRQLVAFGELYLDGGVVGTTQVVPAEWVRRSIVPRARSGFSRERYGYGWWIRRMAGRDAFYAWGYGGQYVFVVPSLDLVVVSTSAPTADDARRSHRRTVERLIEDDIVAVLAEHDLSR